MEIALTGRNALVCGASAGIGRAAALALASLGASVTTLARSRSKLEALAPDLRAAGAPAAHVLEADLDDRPAVRRAVLAHIAAHGPIHVLVHNTGGPAAGPILDAREEEFIIAFSRHVLSAHLLLQLALPGMREAGYGRMVNVLSFSVKEPIRGLGVSNTIRAAMAAWAKSVSHELPPGVTINNVLPGYTATERLDYLAETVALKTGTTPDRVVASWVAGMPEGRLGKPEEIGAVIAFLASPAASFVRGASLPVDGGRTGAI